MGSPKSPRRSPRLKPPKRNSAPGSGLGAQGSVRSVVPPSPQPPTPSQVAPRRHFQFGRLLRVYGHSMAPVLNSGELVLVREGTYDLREPRRGEIVAARPADFSGRACVKRITALPNERVALGGREWQLGPEQFFLLGDQAERSMDSRSFGPVTRRELLGPVWARVWPWTVFR